MADTPTPTPALTDEQIETDLDDLRDLVANFGPRDRKNRRSDLFDRTIAAVIDRAKREERERIGAQTIYVVQEWVDADGIHDGWNTAYGGFTNSLADAERTLEHLRKTHRDTEFRLVTATRSRWKEVTDADH